MSSARDTNDDGEEGLQDFLVSNGVDSAGDNVDNDESFNDDDMIINKDDSIVDNSSNKSYPPMSVTSIHPLENRGRGPPPAKYTPLHQSATPISEEEVFYPNSLVIISAAALLESVICR
jgi:hypothetical protein